MEGDRNTNESLRAYDGVYVRGDCTGNRSHQAKEGSKDEEPAPAEDVAWKYETGQRYIEGKAGRGLHRMQKPWICTLFLGLIGLLTQLANHEEEDSTTTDVDERHPVDIWRWAEIRIDC